MVLELLADSPAVLAAGVFLARVADVSLGTVRTILLFRGLKYTAAAIGFIEVLIWVLAASKVLQNLDAWYLAVAYAGGFAAGNILGSTLENKLALGTELIRVVSTNRNVDLADELKALGKSVIELNGTHNRDSVEVLLVVEKRREVPNLLRTIDRVDPAAFYTISDVKRTELDNRKASRFPAFAKR